MKLLISDVPPALVWKMEHQVVPLDRGKTSLGDLTGVVVPGCGIGVATQQEGCLKGHNAPLARVLQRLERQFLVLREEGHPQATHQPVIALHRVEHQIIQRKGLALDRDAVVRQHQAALGPDAVKMPQVRPRIGELIHGRLHGFLEVVELPRRHLANVAVRVDDPALDLLR